MMHLPSRLRPVILLSGMLSAMLCGLLPGLSGGVLAADADAPLEKCFALQESIERLDCYDELAATRRDIEAVTEALPEGAVKQRLREEMSVGLGDWVITPHGPTYFLPLSYVDRPAPNNQSSNAGDEYDHLEAKLQISFKIPLWINIMGESATLYFGYTQLSLWQMYNSELSSPFRETNYEPELMLGFPLKERFLGMDLSALLLSLNHQSNGQTEPFSRSWNRIIANFLFSSGNFVVNVRPWYRIPEEDAVDDNPDIDKYMGSGEIHAYYKSGDNVVAALLRNNLREDNKGAIQLDWSYQMHPKVKGYIQLFSGYGDSLIDYDRAVTRFGIGIMLTNWI